ncbi:glycoside hydrolase family 5 protein [Methylobacterium nonmethylotrophicum]|uniref:Glycosyl hydrolase family 5 n=1 Tax=Methylobacterium nonmethylotrophicum TaxID=1141884 RepID=A0A4Z0NRC5_9HYPH|nr:cellulase family glycosylhydrolase [Methylobacterium nonmethylotrophicum]TGD99409.1 glycosyl hydrolase family 5 [Methylobacterium nonmethylotrophicum]
MPALDRRRVTAALLAAALPPRRAAAGPPGAGGPIVVRRGVNLWPWFSLTREYPPPRTDYGWPAFQSERPVPTAADLRGLARAGFDFVRLPVDPGPFLAFADGRRTALLAELDAAVAAVLAARLKIVVNLHGNAATHHFNPPRLYGGPDAPLLPPYRALVADLARMLARHPPDTIAFEPVNEPPQACSAASWAGVQVSLLTAARAAAPRLTLVATGACGSMVAGLAALDPAPLRACRPLLYTFHFYEPYLFTHQGAPWMREPVYRALNGVPWPASAGTRDATLSAVRARMRADDPRAPAEREAAYRVTEAKMAEYFAARPDRGFVDRHLGAVAGWASRQGIAPQEILLGEFGALRTDARYLAASAPDRARYVADVRASAEALGFGWAFWNLFDGMGLVRDDETRVLDADLLAALGLPAPGARSRP